MVTTLKDVAELAGVSRSAVSRTFTDGASVSNKTRKKVEEAAEKLNFQPNLLAQSLTTRRTKLIGLVSDNFQNPLFLQVFDLFTKGLQTRGLRPLLVNLSDETDPENSIRMLQQYSVDGVVVASSTLPPEFSEAFKKAGLSVVHAFGRHSTPAKIDVVSVDNTLCGQLAAEYLMQKSYTKVAFLGGPEVATSSQDRLQGFLAFFKNHPNIETSYSFANAYSHQAGFEEMSRLLKQKPAQAYFCGDDVLSIGALAAIQQAGLHVPQDIGIIGLNDMEMAAWQNINLTTIHQPFEKIITTALDLMVEILDTPDKKPENKLFPCHVVERKTV